MSKTWQKNIKLKREVEQLRLQGTPLALITKHIKDKGYSCYESNLSVYFQQNNIKPKFRFTDIKENSDMRTLKGAKEIIKKQMKFLAKGLKKNADSEKVANYLKLVENYRKLSELTQNLQILNSKAEKDYNELLRIILSAEEKFPGLNDYIEKRFFEANENG